MKNIKFYQVLTFLFFISIHSIFAQNNEQNYLSWLSKQKLPDKLSFCGEEIPLEIPEVKERAEREFYLLLQQPGQIILYYKRAGIYFPIFERIIKEEKAPDDLKYLSIAESALYMARSPKDAVGLWQFIEATGKEMGLIINDYIDERRNVEKSTRAAIKYLKDGYVKVNSWTLTAAGYNMGPHNINSAMNYQNKTNYFDLFLNDETSRYIFRIAIIKEILQNPERYGIDTNRMDIYHTLKTRTISYDKAIPNLSDWAKIQGSNFKDLKLLNPWILKKELPNPKKEPYEIILPAN